MIISRDGNKLEITLDDGKEANLLFDVVDGALMAKFYWQEASTDLSPEEELEITWQNVILNHLLEQIADIRKELKNEKRY